MKKRGLLALLLPCIFLSSCNYMVYNHCIDEDYHLRVLQYDGYSKDLAVDEYYYREDKYDGEIAIDITIPESIGGMPVSHFGRYSTTEVGRKYYHDGAQMNRSSDINFAVVCSSYFEEGTVLNINIDIEADLEVFNLFVPYYDPDYGYLEILNNNDLKENLGYAPECNLYISIAESSTKYYSVDGEVYERRSDGKDKKLSTRNPMVYAHGNLWEPEPVD